MTNPKRMATGIAEMVNIETPSPKYQNHWIKFNGVDDESGECIESNMSSWYRPIPVFKPNKTEPVDGKLYEGMKVRCRVQYSERDYNGNTYYNVHAILVLSNEEPIINPFEDREYDVSDFAGAEEPDEPDSPIRSLNEI